MPQLVYTDPTFQVAASNLGRLFSPQVAAQGQLMQAQRGQIDSATRWNNVRADADAAQAERDAAMWGNRAAVADASGTPLMRALVGSLPSNDLRYIPQMNREELAFSALNDPDIPEGNARIAAMALTGSLPSQSTAITQGEIARREGVDANEAAFNAQSDLAKALAVQGLQNQGSMARQVQEQQFGLNNPQARPVDALSIQRQQERYNSYNQLLNQWLSGVPGAESEETPDGISINTGFPEALRADILKKTDAYIQTGEPKERALGLALGELVAGGLDGISVRGAGNGWLSDAFTPNANEFTVNRVSPTPGAPPPATAPTSQSTSQSGAAPGAGASPETALPLPYAEDGKPAFGSMRKGLWYMRRDGSVRQYK